MLSIQKIRDVSYYQDFTAIDDYYGAPLEPRGQWRGSGAAALGLAEDVDAADLGHIFSGFSPAGEPLVQNAGKTLAQSKQGHRPGWDLTFSASKSVSVLWALCDSERRATIEACHDAAVETVLKLAERECGWSRRGQAGRTIERAKLVIAAYQHGTSRALDPNLHTHCLVANLGVCDDGRTRTLVSQTFYRWKMTLGQLYQNELSHQLQQRLGVAVTATANGFEIAGIPKPLADIFSKRRAQIEEQLRRTGRHSAKAAEIAALDTRGRKTDQPRAMLVESWQAVAAELGFSQPDAHALLQHRQAPGVTEKAIATVVARAIDELTQSQAHFTKREVLRTVTHELIGQGASSATVANVVARYLHRSPDVIHLQERDLERHYTTQAVVSLEAQLLATANHFRTQETFAVPGDAVEATFLKHVGVTARPEQVRAVQELVAPQQLSLLTGGPGTGKTFVLDAARDAWERAGYRVMGAALAGKAAQELAAKASIPSDTIAKLLRDLDATPLHDIQHHTNQVIKAALKLPTRAPSRLRLDRHTVLVIDEAGMLDTPHLARLMAHAERAGAKVVLVGDPQQLPPIGAGSPFRALLSHHTYERLSTNERQADQADRDAIRDFAAGRIREAVAQYEKRGRLSIGQDRRQTLEKLTADWASYGGLQNPERHRIFVATNADRIAINDRCQSLRIEHRIINPDESLSIRRRESVEGRKSPIIREDFHVGDPVLCLKRSRSLSLENGTAGVVTSLDRENQTLTIAIHDGQREKAQTIPLRIYPHITRGYAQTTHKGQGQTVENAYILLGGPMQNREMTYVQISRAKQATRLYADALDAGPKREGLYAMLERSTEKLLAHDLLDDIERPAPGSRDLDRALQEIDSRPLPSRPSPSPSDGRLRIDEGSDQNQKSTSRREHNPRLTNP